MRPVVTRLHRIVFTNYGKRINSSVYVTNIISYPHGQKKKKKVK